MNLPAPVDTVVGAYGASPIAIKPNGDYFTREQMEAAYQEIQCLKDELKLAMEAYRKMVLENSK